MSKNGCLCPLCERNVTFSRVCAECAGKLLLDSETFMVHLVSLSYEALNGVTCFCDRLPEDVTCELCQAREFLETLKKVNKTH